MYNGDDFLKFMPKGHPTNEILKTADIWEANLIVMGTYGRSGLMRLLVSSVSEYIVRHSTIPVMAVPSK